ncbi:MAG: HEPN domain-containing protein [Nitrospinae bacterium]|nr:HEPN domain-containing protein [Nitrospinota bacterium]
MPEQEALFRKARDSLRGARLLAGDGLYDFAVSRANYSMFYVAERLMGPLPPPSAADTGPTLGHDDNGMQ